MTTLGRTEVNSRETNAVQEPIDLGLRMLIVRAGGCAVQEPTPRRARIPTARKRM
jgi:hypothetical protein